MQPSEHCTVDHIAAMEFVVGMRLFLAVGDVG